MSQKSCADAYPKSPQIGEVKLRLLAPNDLGSVIFGCTKTTINECLSKNLFGLPSRHLVYVQNIRKGMPLFLFNYTDRKLNGIYEAASDGKKNIDATAWTSHGTGKTTYPAQVLVCIRQQCNPLSENLFKPIIKDNYYTANYGQNKHFMFELDHQQTYELIMLFFGQPLPPTTCNFDYTKKSSPLFPPSDSMVLGQGENLQIYKQIKSSDNDLKFQQDSRSGQLFPYESGQEVESHLLSGTDSAEPEEGYNEDPCFLHPDFSSPAGSAANRPRDHLIPEEHSLEEKLSLLLLNRNISFKGGTLREKMDLQGSDIISTCSLEDVAANLKFLKKEATCHNPVFRKQTTINQLQSESPYKEDKFQRMRSIYSNQDADGTKIGVDQNAYIQETVQAGHLHSSSDTELHSFHQSEIQHFFASLSQIRKECLELKESIKEARIEQHREFQTANTLLQILKMKVSSEVSSLRTDVAQLQEQVRRLCSQKEEPNVAKLKGYATSDKPIHCSVDMYTSGSNIYIIGGCDNDQWFRTMDIYFPEVNELRSAPPMLVDITRPCHAASAFDGFIYVFGGGYGKSWYDIVEVFDRRSNQWSLGTPMNLNRSCLAGASISQGIIALGGENDQGPLSNVELYDACTGKWSEYRNMLEKRSNLGAVELGGAVYSLGGFDGSQYLRTVERLDPRHGSWTRIASMNTPRGGLSAALFNGKIYALGGFDGYSFLNTVEAFDPRANKWEKADPMDSPRYHGAAAVVGDTLYLVGGLYNRKSHVEHMECYQEGVGWKLLGPSPIGKRCYASAVVL